MKRYKIMIKKVLPYSFQIFLVLSVIVLLGYIFTHDMRIENKIIEPQPTPKIDAPIPLEPNPHSEHIKMLENQAGVPLSRVAQLIIQEEGVRGRPYQDTKGIVTIGIGRSLETNGISISELFAIVPQVDARFIMEHAIITRGRIKIDSLDVANKIFSRPLSHHDLELLLMDDLKRTKQEAVGVFGDTWHKIDPVRQEAIIDIMFNLGLTHFKKFEKFIAAVKVADWRTAASELLLSQAARQNYSRYNHVSLVIDTGDEQYFYMKGK